MKREISEVEFSIKIADGTENLSDFSCGSEYFDRYIRDFDNQEASSYVITDDSCKKVIGFISVTCSALVLKTSDSGKVITYPAVKIKCFAIDKTYQDMQIVYNTGIKSLLSSDIFTYFVEMFIFNRIAEECYAKYVILDSVPNAVNFYKRCGFMEYGDCFLPEKTLENQDCTPMYYY